MARTDLRERDVSYLAAFPLEATLLTIHGPWTPPLVWDPIVGLRTPEAGTDYECWWAVTEEDKRAHWGREWDRIRGDLNAAAQRVAHGVPL